MAMNAGVWIDHHRAVVVLLTDEGQEMLQIRSDEGVSARSPAGLRAKNAYTPNDFAVEGKREQRVMLQLNAYYDQIIACVREAQAIVILGPRPAQGEFRRRIASQNVKGHIAELKTAPTLTDDQIADYVRQHFQ
jgi:hypothetical protein